MTRGLALLASAVVLLGGCGGVRVDVTPPSLPPCRLAIPADLSVRWISPFDASDRASLSAWCEAVGPVVAHVPSGLPGLDPDPPIVVSWNMAVGEGDFAGLVDDLRVRYGDRRHFVFLLQEAFREDDPPAECPDYSGTASRLGSDRAEDDDILELARELELHAVYVPSMRNGVTCREDPREDRGNAILSTLPLTDVVAIELPFARQRRVAVSATVRHGSRAIRFVSVHFDTRGGHRESAIALRTSLDELQWTESVVIGGDFNAWWPFDGGLEEMRAAFTEADCGGVRTHPVGRLDRIFVRGLATTCVTLDRAWQSDHKPLVALIEGPTSPGP